MNQAKKWPRREREAKPEPKHKNSLNESNVNDTSYSTVSQINNHHVVDFYYHNSIASANVRYQQLAVLATAHELQKQRGIPSYQEQRRELML